MVLEPAVLDAIPDRGCADFGRHVFPRLLSEEKPLCGYKLSEQEGLWWIDRPEDLARVQAEVSGLESEGMFAAPLLES
jgi:NDP-sugar pyrophosphorylase family protein